MWWNLPYYDPEVESYLKRLLTQIVEQQNLSAGGLVVLGFNSIPLTLEKVLAVIKQNPKFRVATVRSFVWNPHRIVILNYGPQ